jgi:hypothetical protein
VLCHGAAKEPGPARSQHTLRRYPPQSHPGRRPSFGTPPLSPPFRIRESRGVGTALAASPAKMMPRSACPRRLGAARRYSSVCRKKFPSKLERASLSSGSEGGFNSMVDLEGLSSEPEWESADGMGWSASESHCGGSNPSRGEGGSAGSLVSVGVRPVGAMVPSLSKHPANQMARRMTLSVRSGALDEVPPSR